VVAFACGTARRLLPGQHGIKVRGKIASAGGGAAGIGGTGLAAKR